MKRMLGLAFLVATLSVAAHAAPEAASPAQPAVEAAADAVVPLPAATQPPVPDCPCSDRDGQSCTTPGAKASCYWVPGEPGICVCQSNYVWTCY